ncbi:MAG: type III ribulose-bisphosphate carboxylase [Nanoarchaeota archaeon]|nr:type III ribulose-bisphosphate carboxylase [Nanoarchaeota archaeon]
MTGYTSNFIDRSYKPSKNDIITTVEVSPAKNVDFKTALQNVAGESSVGTWTKVKTTTKRIEKMAAKVFWYDKKKGLAKIAYPNILFEADNIPQIMSSIAGNIFGMKTLKKLILLDIDFPKNVVKSHGGPLFGIRGVRKILKVKNRPLVGSIIKPKIGLRTKQHAKVAYDAWTGGLDIIKDDENLSDQKFNPFKDRVIETLAMRDKAEQETGEKKVYMANITANIDEMIERAEFIKKNGGRYFMVDVVTVGFSALEELQQENKKLKLVAHAHRAMHAATTRSKDFGISMLSLAKIYRILGADQLHVGTVVGKMEGGKKEVTSIERALRENSHGMKKTFPVASGGLYPGAVQKMVKIMGKDIIIQAGGGVHGHPNGTFEGAKALRQAVEATMKGIPLKKYAKKHSELAKAIKKWGTA